MRLLAILINLLFINSYIYGQGNNKKQLIMNTNETFLNNVHPEAKKILSNALYWDLDNPNGPFSLNRISNTFGEFTEWRNYNQKANLLDYFPEIGYNALVFDRNKTDIETIKAFYKVHYDMQKSFAAEYAKMFDSMKTEKSETILKSQENAMEETAQNMGKTALREHDDKIISIGFGQFITEGVIDPEMKVLTEKAIIRQLLPFVLEQFQDTEYREGRARDLTILLNDLNKIK